MCKPPGLLSSDLFFVVHFAVSSRQAFFIITSLHFSMKAPWHSCVNEHYTQTLFFLRAEVKNYSTQNSWAVEQQQLYQAKVFTTFRRARL